MPAPDSAAAAPGGLPPPPAPRFAALAHRDFRLYLAAHVLSRAGSQFQAFALSWHVYLLTDSPLALGLIGAAKVAPVLLLALGGGVLADAYDRRRVMLFTQAGLAATSAAMAVLTWSGRASAPALFALIAASGVALAFDNPARAAMVTNLVPRKDLPNALGISVLGWQMASVLGPSVAGLLLARTSLTFLYAADAATFVVMIGAVLAIRSQGRARAADEPRLSGWRSALEGVRFLRGQPVLLAMMGLDFIATFFAGALLLMPIYADKILHVGEKGLGLLMAAPSVGALLAGAWIAATPPIRRQGFVMLAAVAAYGACIAAFGVSTSFTVSLVLLAGSGAADAVSTVVRVVARNLLTPDALRGRMTSINMLFFMGGPQLGELEAGVVAQLTTVPVSVAGGGLLCLAAVAATAALVPQLRRHRIEHAPAEEAVPDAP